MIVDNLWAIITTVLSCINLSIAFCTLISDSESSEEVASSKTKIEGSLKIALPIEIRCFCPPYKVIPLSPITVSNLFGNELT